MSDDSNTRSGGGRRQHRRRGSYDDAAKKPFLYSGDDLVAMGDMSDDYDEGDDEVRMPAPVWTIGSVPGQSPAVHTPTFNRRMSAVHTFTWRSTIIGQLLGTVIVFQNMYFFLKSGLGFGGAFTAALSGWMVVRMVSTVLPFPFSPAEHCYLVAVAVATGGGAIAFGFVGPILALDSTYNSKVDHPSIDFSWPQFIVYSVGLCTYGIFMAIPFRQQMIVKDDLPFPTGKATAVLISSLQRGSERTRALAQTLFASFVPSFTLKCARWCFQQLDSMPIFGHRALCYTWMEDWSTAFWGSALLMPAVVPYGMMCGAILSTVMSVLLLDKQGKWFPRLPDGPYINGEMCPGTLQDLHGVLGYLQMTAVTMFFVDGVCLLSETMYEWYTDEGDDDDDDKVDDDSAVGGNGDGANGHVQGHRASERHDTGRKERDRGVSMHMVDAEVTDKEPALLPVKKARIDESEEIPRWWWQLGLVVSVVVTVACVPPTLHWASDGDVKLNGTLFGQTLVAMVLAPAFGFVVAYTYGKSDQGLVLLGGKIITALVVLWSGDVKTALGLAAVGACLSTQACDTLQVLKTGDMLKASPRAILIGQLIGAFTSIPVGILAYKLFTSAYRHKIPGPDFQAPLAVLFSAIAQLFEGHDLPLHYEWFLLAGGLYVCVYHAIKVYFKYPPWLDYIPIPFALALGLYIPPFVALDFTLGTLAKLAWRHARPDSFEERHQAVAAGMISGEGVAGVITAGLTLAFPDRAHWPIVKW